MQLEYLNLFTFQIIALKLSVNSVCSAQLNIRLSVIHKFNNFVEIIFTENATKVL